MIVVAAGYALLRTVETSQMQQLDHQLTAALPIAIATSVQPRASPKVVQRQEVKANFSDFYVATLDRGRRSAVLAPEHVSGDIPRVPAVSPANQPSDLHPMTVESVSGAIRWRAVLIRRPGSAQDVLVAVSLASADATAARMREALWGALAAVGLVLVASGVWLERLGLRPINQVVNVADAITSGDRSRRLNSSARSSRTEAAQLARAFNVMLDELQADERRLRQFVADASHELRTPVATIRGVAELWGHGHLRQGPALDDALRRIGQESARIASLVEGLLLLARLDEEATLAQTPVDLVALVREVVFDSSAFHPSRQIDLEMDESLSVMGDQDALRRAVSNLVKNALVHTSSALPVTIRVRRTTRLAVLEIIDCGPGMDDAEASRAFDRFWRSDTSRSRPGTGLGLSIVSAIVAAHGGTVTLTSAPATGTNVRVELPSDGLAPEADGADTGPESTVQVSSIGRHP
jgi:two-component system OmpR family sensor kinase